MILVTVGSQKFPFNRLLKKIDQLIEEGTIIDEVFAQIGVSDYKPKNYKYVDFLPKEELQKKMDEADMLITHAGTGMIINAVKKGKKVLATPRLSKYKEHVDDHQIQIIEEFSRCNLIEPVFDLEELPKKIELAKKKTYQKYVSNKENIIDSIVGMIESQGEENEKNIGSRK